MSWDWRDQVSASVRLTDGARSYPDAVGKIIQEMDPNQKHVELEKNKIPHFSRGAMEVLKNSERKELTKRRLAKRNMESSNPRSRHVGFRELLRVWSSRESATRLSSEGSRA